MMIWQYCLALERRLGDVGPWCLISFEAARCLDESLVELMSEESLGKDSVFYDSERPVVKSAVHR